MTRTEVNKYPIGTPEYVVMHALYKKSRGRKPSAILDFVYPTLNPAKALKKAKIFAHFPPTINIQDAKKVAEIFNQIPEVQAVEVFGSVARGKEGHDLDLILICDEETSQLFMRLVEAELRCAKLEGSFYSDCTLTRSEVAEGILGWNGTTGDDEFFNEVRVTSPVEIDIFIFPPNWRDRLTELQGRMEHDDPKFMEKIAKDARRIA